MKISAISDVHVRRPNDEAYKLLISFLNHPDVISSDYIFLLGDIFDLMCGPHNQYLVSFDEIFKSITALVDLGKKVYFFEGNHDVHLEKLFGKIWKNGEVTITQKPLVLTLDDKTYYLSHGDEHEVENLSYQRYMKFIRTKPLKFIADYIMPYFILNYIGTRASKMSRKKGSRIFDSEAVKTTFRKGAFQNTQGQYDFILGGHSHVQDYHLSDDQTSLYINNGYALNSKTFILIENHQLKFQKIN